MSIAALRPHTDAVITAVETIGKPVGDADAEGLTAPYYVVYPIPGGRRGGTLANPHEDSDIVYQVTCVGETREQTEWLLDEVTEALLGWGGSGAVPGRSITFVDISDHPGVRPDRSVTPPVYFATPRFTISSRPA